ncbi:MAG: hypothetical protein SO119_05545 [Phascolarctobacterium sp.]|nr:hypothetical protein [Phascolarctobacterium sp.]
MKTIDPRQTNFRLFRNYLNLTLDQVARALEVSPTTIRNAELGKHVNEETIDKMVYLYQRCATFKQQQREERKRLAEERKRQMEEWFGV